MDLLFIDAKLSVATEKSSIHLIHLLFLISKNLLILPLKNHFYMSQFLSDSSDYNIEPGSDIDFTSAVRLPQQGSASEVYKTRWQRRTVLVKRLKEEFRDSPLNRDALEKEYEIGVNLNHPSQPPLLSLGTNSMISQL